MCRGKILCFAFFVFNNTGPFFKKCVRGNIINTFIKIFHLTTKDFPGHPAVAEWMNSWISFAWLPSEWTLNSLFTLFISKNQNQSYSHNTHYQICFCILVSYSFLSVLFLIRTWPGWPVCDLTKRSMSAELHLTVKNGCTQLQVLRYLTFGCWWLLRPIWAEDRPSMRQGKPTAPLATHSKYHRKKAISWWNTSSESPGHCSRRSEAEDLSQIRVSEGRKAVQCSISVCLGEDWFQSWCLH